MPVLCDTSRVSVVECTWSACTKPVPLEQGEVKRDLSTVSEQAIYLSWRPVSVLGYIFMIKSVPDWNMWYNH